MSDGNITTNTRPILINGDEGFVFSRSKVGRHVICRIANGLVIFWDRKTKQEYVGGRATIVDGKLLITIEVGSTSLEQKCTDQEQIT